MRLTNFFLLSLLIGCSLTEDDPDPFREFNKDMLELNLILDENLLKPLAEAYEDAPGVARESVSNILSNLKEPFYCLNHLSVLDAENAASSLFRFVINSTLGAGGIFDIGSLLGLERNEVSYKDTLRKMCVPTGDYLILPILGSSSTRDVIAEPISWFADPISYVIGFPWMFAKSVLGIIVDRSENAGFINNSVQNSINLYSTVKSVYTQKYGDREEGDEFPEEDFSNFDNI
ncbi:MAG: MlaA family lipoprotein [Holosporaceae bacterium]|jgi:phospholipid-binding lipoprotein MlaA|nr:MlaA family lipoprotein [Holosporaceae bacterium]